MKTNSTSTPVTPSITPEMLEAIAKTVAEMATKAVAEALKTQKVEVLKASTPASHETETAEKPKTEEPKAVKTNSPENTKEVKTSEPATPWWVGMGEHFVCNTRDYKPKKACTETAKTETHKTETHKTEKRKLSEAQRRQIAEAGKKYNETVKADREARFAAIKDNAFRVRERKNGKKTVVEYFDRDGKCLATECNGKFTLHK